ncbi:MAG: radical SAM protein [Magnetococcales bacterium]|nr:radical SAM protein [Magnetococcales bacterium]
MKTALVNPPLAVEENYGSLSGFSPEMPQLGIAFITGFLKQNGFEVDLLDLGGTIYSETVKRLTSYDVVGFSTYITNAHVVQTLSRDLKDLKPEITLIAGGPHVTLFPQDMEGYGLDYVVSGDGELPMLELMQHLVHGHPISDYNGIGVVDGGRTVRFPASRSRKIDDLDIIGPPDTSQYALENYFPPAHVQGRKVIHTLTTRGCPFKCTFCAAAEVMGRRMRFRNPDNVVEELLHYKEMGYDSVIFYDDIFTIRRRHVMELCEAMIKADLGFDWCCFTRTNVVQHPEMLAAMKESGCYLITFGCESANDHTLKLLRKGLSVEQNLEGIERVHQAGIMTFSSFMIGLPGETAEDIRHTIRWARDSKLDFAVFPIFEPFKGTPVYDDCKQLGSWQTLKDQSNNLLSNQSDIWVPNGITRKEVVLLAREAFKSFYFRPRRFLGVMRYVLTRLPPERSLTFIKGGIDYFLTFAKKSDSQHNTHY